MPDVVSLSGVSLVRGGQPILDRIDWTIRDGERWVVLGPNGAGKTTLLGIASLYLFPSSGIVTVLGAIHGRTDVRPLRARIGYASAALARLLHGDMTALEAVATGRTGVLDAFWAEPGPDDLARARALLATVGCAGLEAHELGTLSEGERQRVQIARALMPAPDLLLLDEPAAGLDLGARATLVRSLASLARSPEVRAIAFVTHHVEEIPPGFTHVLLLRGGRMLASGPLEEALATEALSACFGLRLGLERRSGRWTAWAEDEEAERADASAPDPGSAPEPETADGAGAIAPGLVRDPDGRLKAFRPLNARRRHAALEAFLEAYLARRFYEAHELLEPAWMGTDDPAERAFHQGLIKIAAAGVHATRGNAQGARQNLAGALRRLRLVPREASGPFGAMLLRVDVPAVIGWGEAALRALEAAQAGAHSAPAVAGLLAAAPAPVLRVTGETAMEHAAGPGSAASDGAATGLTGLDARR